MPLRSMCRSLVWLRCTVARYSRSSLSAQRLLRTPFQVFDEDQPSPEHGNEDTFRRSTIFLEHEPFQKFCNVKVPIPLRHFDLLHVYTRLSLSYPSDILNALAGITGAIERLMGVSFRFGIPVSDQNPQVFLRGLLWVPIAPTARRDSSTDLEETPTTLFPSWSWCGWNGPVRSWLPCFLEILWYRSHFFIESKGGYGVEINWRVQPVIFNYMHKIFISPLFTDDPVDHRLTIECQIVPCKEFDIRAVGTTAPWFPRNRSRLEDPTFFAEATFYIEYQNELHFGVLRLDIMTSESGRIDEEALRQDDFSFVALCSYEEHMPMAGHPGGMQGNHYVNDEENNDLYCLAMASESMS